MKESFWKRKGVKTAFMWMIFDLLLLAVFFYGVFSRGFEEANWLLLLIAAMNTDRIIVPLADLSEPPGIFTFFTGVIPAGVFIAYFVSYARLWRVWHFVFDVHECGGGRDA